MRSTVQIHIGEPVCEGAGVEVHGGEARLAAHHQRLVHVRQAQGFLLRRNSTNVFVTGFSYLMDVRFIFRAV